jgi:hypothetical protein
MLAMAGDYVTSYIYLLYSYSATMIALCRAKAALSAMGQLCSQYTATQ